MAKKRTGSTAQHQPESSTLRASTALAAPATQTHHALGLAVQTKALAQVLAAQAQVVLDQAARGQAALAAAAAVAAAAAAAAAVLAAAAAALVVAAAVAAAAGFLRTT